jgi:Mg-chelatase subunit ChlD
MGVELWRSAGRGTSTAVAVVLLASFTLFTAVLVVSVGGAAIDTVQEQTDQKLVTNSMQEARSRLLSLSESTVPAGSTTFSLPGTDGTSVDVKEQARLTIQVRRADSTASQNDHWNGSAPGEVCTFEHELGTILYERGDSVLAYQGGGVWRRDSATGATRMISAPELTRNGRTIELDLVDVSARETISNGETVITRMDTTESSAVQNQLRSQLGPCWTHSEGGFVRTDLNITLRSPYADAWARYANETLVRNESLDSVSYERGTSTVEMVFLSRGSNTTRHSPGADSSVAPGGPSEDRTSHGTPSSNRTDGITSADSTSDAGHTSSRSDGPANGHRRTGAEKQGFNDADRDGIRDSEDNCRTTANHRQRDADADGLGDACDGDDTDGDGVPDLADNCPAVANGQNATTGVGSGTACLDDDDDGVPNGRDGCPSTVGTGANGCAPLGERDGALVVNASNATVSLLASQVGVGNVTRDVTPAKTRRPMDVVFVLDTSRSMRWNDRYDRRVTATAGFLEELNRTHGDRAGAVEFNSTHYRDTRTVYYSTYRSLYSNPKPLSLSRTVALPERSGWDYARLGPKRWKRTPNGRTRERVVTLSRRRGAYKQSGLTSDFDHVTAAINRGEWGGTNMSAGMRKAIGEFERNGSSDHEKVIVFLSDGQNDGDGITDAELDRRTKALASEAQRRNITVYTVGLGAKADTDLLRRVSERGGGEYYPVDDAQQLDSAFDRIVRRAKSRTEHRIEHPVTNVQVRAGGMRRVLAPDGTLRPVSGIDVVGSDVADPTVRNPMGSRVQTYALDLRESGDSLRFRQHSWRCGRAKETDIEQRRPGTDDSYTHTRCDRPARQVVNLSAESGGYTVYTDDAAFDPGGTQWWQRTPRSVLTDAGVTVSNDTLHLDSDEAVVRLRTTIGRDEQYTLLHVEATTPDPADRNWTADDDVDDDGITDEDDNCPWTPNHAQRPGSGGVGEACDDDSGGDGGGDDGGGGGEDDDTGDGDGSNGGPDSDRDRRAGDTFPSDAEAPIDVEVSEIELES